VWLFGGVGVGWNTARLHFDFEPPLTLIRKPLALSPTAIAFYVMIFTFAFRILTLGAGLNEQDFGEEIKWEIPGSSSELSCQSARVGKWKAPQEILQGWARWQGWFLINREVKIGSVKCRNGRELFTRPLLLYPISVTKRTWRLLIYVVYLHCESRN
jgi:hypothetical protein